MKIILTGGTGFIGSHLLSKLLNKNYEVILLKRTFSTLDRVRSIMSHKNLILFDLDRQNLEDIFSSGDIQMIVHLATEYGRSKRSINLTLQANLNYPIELLELAIKYGVKNFISSDSYFNKNNSIYSYLQNYSLSKRAFTSYFDYFSDKIHITNVVLEHVYGPMDSSDKFVEKLIQDIAINQLDRVALTSGYQKRDFVYVDDVTDAYISIIDNVKKEKYGYKTFELGTGLSTELRTFANAVKSISNSTSSLEFGAIEYRCDEIMESMADNSALRALGWSPKTSIHQGLSKIIHYYRPFEKLDI